MRQLLKWRCGNYSARPALHGIATSLFSLYIMLIMPFTCRPIVVNLHFLRYCCCWFFQYFCCACYCWHLQHHWAVSSLSISWNAWILIRRRHTRMSFRRRFASAEVWLWSALHTFRRSGAAINFSLNDSYACLLYGVSYCKLICVRQLLLKGS